MNKEIKELNHIYSLLPEGELDEKNLWGRIDRREFRFSKTIFSKRWIGALLLIFTLGIAVAAYNSEEESVLHNFKEAIEVIEEKLEKVFPYFSEISNLNEDASLISEPETKETYDIEQKNNMNSNQQSKANMKESIPSDNLNISDEIQKGEFGNENVPGLEIRTETPAGEKKALQSPSEKGNKGDNPGQYQSSQAKEKGNRKLRDEREDKKYE